MTVGHLTVPVLGYTRRYPRSATQMPPYGWHGRALEAFHAGTLGAMSTHINADGTIVVGGTRIAFHALTMEGMAWLSDGPTLFKETTSMVVEGAIDALQAPYPFFPTYDLMDAWARYGLDTGSRPTARVFSHPEGWVLGTDEADTAMEEAFEILASCMRADPSDPDSDLSTLPQEDFSTGTYACVIVDLDPEPSKHEQIAALGRAQRVFDAWKASSTAWIHPTHLDVPCPIPFQMDSRLKIVAKA